MSFRTDVYNIVKSIPRGKVMTYGQVAALAGSARAARQVGYALRALTINELEIPWWRVVSKSGYISIDHGDMGLAKEHQRNLLAEEGVGFSDELTVDMSKYRAGL